MSTFTLLLLVGLASTACQIVFALSVHRLRLLIFSLAACCLFLVQYALIGQWLGFVSGLVGAIYTLMLALAYRFPVLQRWVFTGIFITLYLVVFLLMADWRSFEVASVIPLLAGSATLVALHARNLIVTKTIMLTAGAGWLLFEFSNTMYTQMLGEGFELIGNIIALCALLAARQRGIAQADMLNIDEQALQTFTDAIHIVDGRQQMTR